MSPLGSPGSRPLRTFTLMVLGAAGVLSLAGCSRDVGVFDPRGDEPADSSGVASVTLHSTRNVLTVLGTRERILARARDPDGTVVCYVWFVGCASWLLQAPFEWEKDVPGIVSLEREGMSIGSGVYVTALAEGRVKVTASVAGVEAREPVEIEVVERARIAWSARTMGASVGIAVGEDGTIYMAGSAGLQAVGAGGDVRWELPVRAQGTPAIAEDGTIYLGTGDGLTAIDPDGQVLWVTPIERIWSPPAIGPDGTIYQGTSVGTLYAVDPTGEIQWEFEAPPTGSLFRNPSSPAIAENGTIYYGSQDHRLYAIDPDGSERWRFRTEGPVRTPSIGADGTIYFGNDRITEWGPEGLVVLVDSRLFAANPDGTERWSAPLEGKVWAGPAIGFDGEVYMGTSSGGSVHVFTPDGALTRKGGPGTGHTPIVAGDGSVYLSFSGVSALERDGTTRWNFRPENFAAPVPAIGFDGKIYAAASDRNHVSSLYAFEELEANPGDYHSAPWPQERGDRANTGRARGLP